MSSLGPARFSERRGWSLSLTPDLDPRDPQVEAVTPTCSPLGSHAHTELINFKCPYPLSHLTGPTGCFKYY